VNVVPLAADSLGVRSMATYVECGQTRILIDPGAALAPNRFGLSPADEEWEALKRANDRISAYATRAGISSSATTTRITSGTILASMRAGRYGPRMPVG
jgi:predicted metallo-beta-lactamase superfamily hydrolase